jgi:large subunit ribosomal protein L29
MEIDDLRGLTDDELAEDLVNSRRALMNLRFRTTTMQIANVKEISGARKRIARIHTVTRERELAKAAI